MIYVKYRRLLMASLLFLPIFGVSAMGFVVAKDGSGTFGTVQEAILAVPDFRKETTTIFVKRGVYKEKLIIPSTKINVHIIGEDVSQTIFTYDDFAQKRNVFGEEIGTSGSASFYSTAEDLIIEGITFENSSGPVGQAVAAWVSGDRVQFISCRFLGYQDTLYTHGKGSRQYYFQCYIEGTVDFIFGSSTAWFEQCEIHCKRSGYITAASTPDTVEYGYVFDRCRITGNAEQKQVYLGRPWRPHAKVVFMRCDLPDFIRPEGWDNWRNPENERTAYFAEYKNVGEGATPSTRVAWSRQLTDEDASKYSLSVVFDGWIPSSKLSQAPETR